jgi:hypothetical protein
MSEAKTDKPNKSALWALGCLLGFCCGVAGTTLGRYWGAHFLLQQQAQVRMQASDILRAKGRTVDANDIPPPFVLVGTVYGGALGWGFGWLLTAFIPRRRTRTRRDYVLVVVVGLLPLSVLIAPIIARHLLP